ncbi:MAG: DUF4345 domain-containing protein [Myxococcota bacterium]
MTDQHDQHAPGMRPDTLRRVAVGVAALIFGGFGAFFLGWPTEMANQVQITADTPATRTEIRAMYGGLQVGFATFLLLCVVLRRWLVAGLVAIGLVCAGLAAGRVLGVVLDEPDNPVIWMLLAAESAGAIVVAVVLWVARRRKPGKKAPPKERPASKEGGKSTGAAEKKPEDDARPTRSGEGAAKGTPASPGSPRK